MMNERWAGGARCAHDILCALHQVTFFWNGNRSGKFDEKLETYHEVSLLCDRT